jgi:hypothetical protein
MSHEIATQLPEYECHKVVRAALILAVIPEDADFGAKLMLSLRDHPSPVEMHVSAEYVLKHTPKAGGYYVLYKDGYESYSPAEAFEEGYSLKRAVGDICGIGWAIKQMHNGARVMRAGWNGKGMWLALQVPDEHSKMTLPYIYIEYPQGHPAYPDGCRVPWLASQTDILATDYSVMTS